MNQQLRQSKLLVFFEDTRPTALYVPPPTRNEIRVFFLLSIVSIVAAVLIAWDYHRFNSVDWIFPWSIAMLGIAHAFVFIGMLRFIRVQNRRMIEYAAACVLFPVWGFIVGLGGCLNILPIVLCSTVWGFVLGYLLESKLAVFLFFVLGLAPLIAWRYISASSLGGMPLWYFEGTIVMWHVPASFTILILGIRRRAILSKLSTARCQFCGYDCIGIEEQGGCPECGSSEIDTLYHNQIGEI